MFIDRAVVRVVGGTGGSGASSFARFKYKPKGGPDGGDGGDGGSVLVRADANLSTLLDYRYRTEWKAERGEHGKGKTKTGASTDDRLLPVPPGTVISRCRHRRACSARCSSRAIRCWWRGAGGADGQRALRDLHPQAPREWEPGEEGEDRRIELVLKLIADVGLVGEPNAGKSTLLSVVSAARPKIADYPFTTLEPNLGVVGALAAHRTFVVADIPGIIEGAHEGKGLGLQFLQHVERTRVLAFLIPLDSPDPQARLRPAAGGDPAVQRRAGVEGAHRDADQAGPPAAERPVAGARRPRGRGNSRRVERGGYGTGGAEGVSSGSSWRRPRRRRSPADEVTLTSWLLGVHGRRMNG